MLDLTLIRTQPDTVRAGIAKKCGDVSLVERILDLDASRRELRTTTEGLRAELNAESSKMASATAEQREQLRGSLRELSDRVASHDEQLRQLDEQVLVLQRQIPNIPAAEVPEGKSDKENVVVRTVGQKQYFDFEPKDHEQLGLALDLFDFERAAKISGNKFYFLKNELVILEQSVLRFALDRLIAAGATPMTVPIMVREAAMYGAAHFATPEDGIDGDAYQLERDNLYLAGTAEVSLVNYHAGEILTASEVPKLYVGISPCYRRESGTYGKEARGLYRVHAFNKIEMVSIVRPEDSEKEHERLLAFAEDLLQALGLSYQVVLNCGGDLGTPQYKKWDVETWMPGMGKYGETHSCSNDTDYQARRINLRFREDTGGQAGELRFVHTLNNTALASPRILIPLLETYQQADGSILIPEVLRPYTGFDRITAK
jgi:seryl-tRNA synthetase